MKPNRGTPRKFRIVSLDGGGVRGLLTATLLARLEAAVPGFLSRADLFAGTSTGGILALGLAYGFTPQNLVDLYRRIMPQVFRAPWWHRALAANGLCGPKYAIAALVRELNDAFRDTKLGELGRYVLIPAVDLSADSPRLGVFAKPKFFHNLPGVASDRDALVTDVALYTSAAPVYFPSSAGYADGGLVANSPALCAAAQVFDRRYDSGGPWRVEDLVILSVGTGQALVRIRKGWFGRSGARSRRWWGLLQWGGPVIKLMMDGMNGTTDYICHSLLGGKYLRYQYLFDQEVALDAWDRAEELISMAGTVDLGRAESWLEQNWK